MAPRRATRNNNNSDGNSSNHNNNSGSMSNAELVALVTQQIAAVVPNMVVQIIQALGGVGNGQGSGNASRNINNNGNANADHKRKAECLDSITTPITQIPPAQKPYENFPQCSTCKRHHPTTSLCRSCTNCGRFGHLAKTCRKPMNPNINHQQRTMSNEQPPRFNYGQCFECGDLNHYRDRCPNLLPNQAPPATQVQIFAITATEEEDAAT